MHRRPASGLGQHQPAGRGRAAAAPGHGGAGRPAGRACRSSPHGTRRTWSAGERPPPSTAVTTASGPRMPCTRLSARCARSPLLAGLAPQAGLQPGVRRPPRPGSAAAGSIPAVGRAGRRRRRGRLVPESQPSSCQRTRSAMAAAVSSAVVPPDPVQLLARARCAPRCPAGCRPARARPAARAAARPAPGRRTRPRRPAPAARRTSPVTVQVGRRLPDGERAVVPPGGEPVGQRRVEAEPGQHVAGRQRGELAEGAHAQPAQQVGQLRPVRAPRRAARRGTPASRPARTIRPARAASTAAKTPSAMPTWLSTPQRLRHVLDDPLGGRLLAAEVAGRPPGGQRAGARDGPPPPRRELLDRGDHRLERPRVPAGVVLHDGQLRAAALRLPLAQPAAHPLGPGRRSRRPPGWRAAPRPGRCAGTPSTISAAITGQSGHQTSRVRTGAPLTPPRPADMRS